MAPKDKGKADNKAKGNAKAGSAKDGAGGKLKAATAINTRHILVRFTHIARSSPSEFIYSVRSIQGKKKP